MPENAEPGTGHLKKLSNKGEIEIHQDMIKDFTPEAAQKAAGVWQFEFWLPSTEQKAADFEAKMSKQDPKGWAEHRQKETRTLRTIL